MVFHTYYFHFKHFIHFIPPQITPEKWTEYSRHSEVEEYKYRATDAFIDREIEPIIVRIRSESTDEEDEDDDYQP